MISSAGRPGASSVVFAQSASPRAFPPSRRAPGWEEVADYALEWAVAHAAQPKAA